MDNWSRCKVSRQVMILLPFYLFVFLPICARPHLGNLDIRVELSPNGDARITETRQMSIDSEGTECYIVIGNLSGSEVRDLTVTDETGTVYENIGEWVIDRSRSQKQNRCGIVYKRNGYELCWGLGQSGSRTYTTSYTVTRLVKGYEDADGFNYMFVAEGINPYPDHVKLTIVPADTTQFTTDNTRIWGFRYRGEVNLIDGNIVAETTESFSRESAMIVMAAFNKGIFQPEDTLEGKFEDLQNRAFEGSDYIEEKSFFDKLMAILFLCFWLFIALIPVFYTAYKLWKIWRANREINRNLLWYRDIPYNGDLLHANGIINAYKYVHANYSNLLSAEILKLIYLGSLKVQQVADNKGKPSPTIVIGEEPKEEGEERDVRLRRQIYKIFSNAAGKDGILQPKELERYMERKAASLQGFSTLLHRDVKFEDAERERKIGPNDRVSQVFGLRKYLKDFTLANERHVQEVGLWKDYLIYATLFGNADQVLKDMKEINPEYLQMDQIAQVMDETVVIPAFTTAANNGVIHVQHYVSPSSIRSSGGGGRVSWGGGGGFSGGGVGGGVR